MTIRCMYCRQPARFVYWGKKSGWFYPHCGVCKQCPEPEPQPEADGDKTYDKIDLVKELRQ
jgi:hypothetical protein